jgi:hypothetical protein
MDEYNLLLDLSSRPSKTCLGAKIKVVDQKTKIKNLQPTRKGPTTKKQIVLR